jgi:hypothetical protein
VGKNKQSEINSFLGLGVYMEKQNRGTGEGQQTADLIPKVEEPVWGLGPLLRTSIVLYIEEQEGKLQGGSTDPLSIP